MTKPESHLLRIWVASKGFLEQHCSFVFMITTTHEVIQPEKGFDGALRECAGFL